MLFPLALLIARGLKAITQLQLRGLSVLLAIKGLSERSRSKKALAISFLLKGVPFCDSGLSILLAVKGLPERSRLKKALAISFLLKGFFFYNSGIITYLALRDKG